MNTIHESGIREYLRGLLPNARIRLGLLSNPLAKTNWQSVGHGKLAALLPERDACRETPSLGTLVPALEDLLFRHGVNVLVVNGGDGTIHHTLNAAIDVVDRASTQVGERVSLPLFLFVNGGGMNMLARVFGTRGHPVRTLRRFLAKTRGARVGTLHKRAVPLLAVDTPEDEPRYGYIFGSELVFNALTMYERFGQGYPGLARFLYEVGAGWMFRTELWHRYGHLLDAPETPLAFHDSAGRVDHFPRYTSVVATTVPLQLVKGLVAPVRHTASPGGMSVVAVLPVDKGEVIQKIPSLMLGADSEGLVYRSDVKAIDLHGAFTLDGERYVRREAALVATAEGAGNAGSGVGDALTAIKHAPLTVRGTERVVWGVSL